MTMKANKYILYRKDLGYCKADARTTVREKIEVMEYSKIKDSHKPKHYRVSLTGRQIKHYKKEGFEVVIIKD